MRKFHIKTDMSSGLDIHDVAYCRMNYNILRLLNKAERCGTYDLPALHCHLQVPPDYLALFSQPSLYRYTEHTAVCFYNWDDVFDGKNGLFYAIYYNDQERLEYFRKRFKDVKVFITPDYSTFGDVHIMENLIRIWKGRIVALWFINELHAVAVPNISYFDVNWLSVSVEGLEDCTMVAMSAKGHVQNEGERRLFQATIAYVVDHLPLKYIIVYSACGNDETCLELFQYAIERGVQVIIPNNTLRERNLSKRGVA